MFAASAAVSVGGAWVASRVLSTHPGRLVLVAGWMAALAIASVQLPRWWRSELEYIVTDRHVIVKRGRFRRTIDRRTLSYARIRWDHRDPTCGDLELVRAVRAGALRRRLSVTLYGVSSPDRVWAILREVDAGPATGSRERPLAQRLDEGERVRWAGRPAAARWAWVPHSRRALVGAAMTVGLAALSLDMALQGSHALERVLAAGLEPGSSAFVVLAGSLVLSIAVLGALAVGIGYVSLVRPVLRLRGTRYLVTNRRVLVQRGLEELHLDRDRVRLVEERPSPFAPRWRDLVLVLDDSERQGSRLIDASSRGLAPVFRRVDDLDGARAALAEG